MKQLVRTLSLLMLLSLIVGAGPVYTYTTPVPPQFIAVLQSTQWTNGAIRWSLPDKFKADDNWPTTTPLNVLSKTNGDLIYSSTAKLLILDGEMFSVAKFSDFLNNSISLRDVYQPGMLVTTYGYWPNANRNQVINEARQPGVDKTIQQALRGTPVEQQFLRRTDIVNLDCYLMGEQWFERDIQYINAACKVVAGIEMFKGKPIYLTVRGSWPDNTGKMVPIPAFYRDVYVNTVKRVSQGVIVFDPTDTDADFIQSLSGN